jgi:hypothetical protein
MAFLIGSQFTLVAIGVLRGEIVIASIITLTACSSYIRYLHLSMALLFCLAVTAAVTYGIFELGVTGKQFTLCNDAICDSSLFS